MLDESGIDLAVYVDIADKGEIQQHTMNEDQYVGD
jgi:hypothetical protein